VITASLLAGSSASRDGLGADAAIGWDAAALIEAFAGDAEAPQVAVDSLGNAIVVWQQNDGAWESIYSNRYEVGRGWWSAALIETGNAGDAENPQVAVDGSGNAIAVWQQNYGSRDSIYSNRYVVGTGWGEAQLVETDDFVTARYPQVAVDESGNAIAVWVQINLDFTSSAVWSNRYVVGTGWGEAQLIETMDVGFAQLPQVAVDGSGNAIAVWYRSSEVTRLDIWSNRYEVGVGWGEAQLIEISDAGNAERPQVAVDVSGNAIAVWYQSDLTLPSIWSNRYVVGTGWGEAQLVETDEYGAHSVSVAVDHSGNAMATWVQSDGVSNSIWSNRYEIGAGWGEAELIETNMGSAYEPQIAVDASGNATVVWVQSDVSSMNIWSNRLEVDAGWGEAQIIETHVDGDEATDPQIAVAESGDAVAVWRQYDGTRWNVWSNRYITPDITPPLLSLGSPSDGLTTGTPLILVSGVTEPRVALEVNGVMIAVWPDGSFSCMVALVEGVNTITATATDAWGNSATVSVDVTYVNPVHALEEELNAVLDELNATQADLDAVEDELDAIKDELSATQDDLDAAEEELSGTSDDLSAMKSQNLLLMAVLSAFAILAIVMSIMFLSLRKKMAEMSIKPSEEETPPPPRV